MFQFIRKENEEHFYKLINDKTFTSCTYIETLTNYFFIRQKHFAEVSNAYWIYQMIHFYTESLLDDSVLNARKYLYLMNHPPTNIDSIQNVPRLFDTENKDVLTIRFDKELFERKKNEEESIIRRTMEPPPIFINEEEIVDDLNRSGVDKEEIILDIQEISDDEETDEHNAETKELIQNMREKCNEEE